MKIKNTFWALIFLSFSQKSVAFCLPDVQRPSLKSLSVDKSRIAEELTTEFEKVLISELPDNYRLTIHLEPLNSRVNAEIILNGFDIGITVWGGMINHALMTKEAFWLLLCHEIGHFLGGAPLKSRTGWSSTEGQADYYSSLKCAKLLNLSEEDLIEGSLALTKIYAEVVREPEPSLDRCDERRVLRTNFGYPSVQCRLDTILSGWGAKSRPECWFKE